MPKTSKHKVLVVDDESSIREILEHIFTSAGYDVATAKDGFDALLHLKRSVPEVVISDLNMPQMSGFEFLSVVRRRFPHVSVIASSGAYEHGGVPSGVIADAFYGKGGQNPEELLAIVGHLIRTSASRAAAHQTEPAPVWIPRNGKDSAGIPFIVITCTECLRSFPLHVAEEVTAEVLETACLFCPSTVRYIIDFSRSVTSPHKAMSVEAESSSEVA
jgi:CheY-like chemotaxis protein